MCWSQNTDITVDNEVVEDPRCIILHLIPRNDNVGDHNINLQHLRITALTADIFSLYQNEFHSSCLHFQIQTIDHFLISITHCS